MSNWIDAERQLRSLVADPYYAPMLKGKTPEQFAREEITKAKGSALEAFQGDITVTELCHPPKPDRPTVFLRGTDTTRDFSHMGAWWIDARLFERFWQATRGLSGPERDQKIRDFMRARSAVSHGWSNIGEVAKLTIPAGARTPALVGIAHHQLYADPKDPRHLPNVFWIGGDLQFYVCVREPAWIKSHLTSQAAHG